jgi:hypothetical protein
MIERRLRQERVAWTNPSSDSDLSLERIATGGGQNLSF